MAEHAVAHLIVLDAASGYALGILPRSTAAGGYAHA
jgi:hypothetical protein